MPAPSFTQNRYNYINKLKLNDDEECNINDFEYHYTECDSKYTRWRFAVPKLHKEHCKNIPAPMSGLNCCK